MPRQIVPAAKQAARQLVEQAQVKLKERATWQRLQADSVVQQVQRVAKEEKKKKAGPSALDPAFGKSAPMKLGQHELKKKRTMKLMNLSVLATMSHPLGEQLATWDKGTAVDCGAEWLQEAIDMALTCRPHLTTIAAEAIALVHEDTEH